MLFERWTHETYIADRRARGQGVPILFRDALGLRLECVMIDVLHCVDQGIASHLIGNVLWYLGVDRGVFGGRNQAEKVKNMYADISEWYKRTHCVGSRVQGAITVERLRTNGNWPKLRAKAAATRHLSHYALSIMQIHGDGSEHDLKVLALCRLLCRFYGILDSESMFLTSGVRAELPILGQQFGILYASLSAQALRDKRKFFKMSPKLHLFVHLCEWQGIEYSNPRFYWCYADEDLVGLMVEVAKTCHPKTMAMNTLFKWLHLEFDCE